uniref:Ig-like domain-containing protein n=1 Tax=Cyanoderma ruficeps TaxID=181631 RepID=A0A8C3QLQ3_9PASS
HTHPHPACPSTCCISAGLLLSSLEQSPDMVIKEGQSVNLECSKKKSSYRAMYWYMRASQKNSSLTQLVYAYEGAKAVVEKGFEGHFKSSDIKGDSITLSIEHAFLNDSGTYYCAESEHSGEAAEGAEHKLVPRVSSSSSLITPSEEEFSIPQGAVQPFSGIRTGCRDGQRGTF